LVKDMTAAERLVREEKGRFSVGGMRSKLLAAKIAVDAGICPVIGGGSTPSNIGRSAAGENVGTRFETARRTRKKSSSICICRKQLRTSDSALARHRVNSPPITPKRRIAHWKRWPMRCGI